MLRLSVTTIDGYIYWRDHEFKSLDELEADIRRESKPSQAMLRGRAFHSVIEHPEETLAGDHYAYEDYRFDRYGIDEVLSHIPKDAIAEAKAEREIEGVMIVGKADALRGLDIYEAKCTGRINVDTYHESYQWRYYLVLFDGQRVNYVLAKYFESKKEPGMITIQEVMPLPCYRYPKLEDDVRRMTAECAEFIVKRNLESYVQQS